MRPSIRPIGAAAGAVLGIALATGLAIAPAQASPVYPIIWDQSPDATGGTPFPFLPAFNGTVGNSVGSISWADRIVFAETTVVAAMSLYTLGVLANGVLVPSTFMEVGDPITVRLWSERDVALSDGTTEARPVGAPLVISATLAAIDQDGASGNPLTSSSHFRMFAVFDEPVTLIPDAYWIGMTSGLTSDLKQFRALLLTGAPPPLDDTAARFDTSSGSFVFSAFGFENIPATGLGDNARSSGDLALRLYGPGVPVPEPASLGLLAIGLVGLGAAMRRRARQGG